MQHTAGGLTQEAKGKGTGIYQEIFPGAGLGVTGAALGTALSEAVTALLMAYFLCFRSPVLRLEKESGGGGADAVARHIAEALGRNRQRIRRYSYRPQWSDNPGSGHMGSA